MSIEKKKKTFLTDDFEFLTDDYPKDRFEWNLKERGKALGKCFRETDIHLWKELFHSTLTREYFKTIWLNFFKQELKKYSKNKSFLFLHKARCHQQLIETNKVVWLTQCFSKSY